MQPSFYTPHDAKILQSISTPTQWQQLWLEKLVDKMSKAGVTGPQNQEWRTILKLFLAEHPGNPRSVSADALTKFVTRLGSDARNAMLFFFEQVAFSQELQDAIKNLVLPETPAEAPKPAAAKRTATKAKPKTSPKPAAAKAKPKSIASKKALPAKKKAR